MCEKEPDRAGECARLTWQLREQLHEMLAASQALEPALRGNEKALACLAVLNRGMFRQLRACREQELCQWFDDPDEVRLSLDTVDLVEVCRSLMERVGALTQALGIRAEFRCARAALVTAADRRALEDMLLALLSGAAGAIGRGGALILELERRERSAALILSEEGGRVDRAELLALFEPDGDGGGELPEQAQNAGRGRGLALAQQIAALHGGVLILDAQEGRGPRLTVSLPVRELHGGRLRSPRLQVDDSGGWDRVRIALSNCLPVESFLPGELKR